MIHPTSMSMGRATGYSSVLGAEAYVEGNEVDLTGSGVGLNSWEELELEGDELETVEIVEGGSIADYQHRGGQGRNRQQHLCKCSYHSRSHYGNRGGVDSNIGVRAALSDLNYDTQQKNIKTTYPR